MDEGLGRYVAHAWRRPSSGPPYVRCGICQRQVYGSGLTRTATPHQIAFVLRNALALHIKHEHPEVE